MKKLLYKEIVLCTNVQIILFTCFALFILIPSWPPAIAFVYPLSGLMSLFPRCLANKDIEYTTLLPIKKTDVVKGKALFLMLVEITVMILVIIGGIIRFFLYKAPSDGGELIYYLATRPSISLIGFGFLSFGIMNFVLLPLYYKNPYKRLTGPNLISLFACILVLLIGSLLIAFIPVFREYDMIGLITQFSVLLVGATLFILFTFFAYKSGSKAFSNIDL